MPSTGRLASPARPRAALRVAWNACRDTSRYGRFVPSSFERPGSPRADSYCALCFFTIESIRSLSPFSAQVCVYVSCWRNASIAVASEPRAPEDILAICREGANSLTSVKELLTGHPRGTHVQPLSGKVDSPNFGNSAWMSFRTCCAGFQPVIPPHGSAQTHSSGWTAHVSACCGVRRLDMAVGADQGSGACAGLIGLVSMIPSERETPPATTAAALAFQWISTGYSSTRRPVRAS